MQNTLSQTSKVLQHPVLILIRGLPGSGKSYLAAALQKSIGANAVVMLDPDTIEYESREYIDHVTAQTAAGVDPKLHPYRLLRGKAHAGIEAHKVIIWNQPFTNLEIFKKMIVNLETHAAEHGTHLPILVVEIAIDPAVAKERITQRKVAGGHGPSDSTFSRFLGEYGSSGDHGYNVVTVHGQDDVSISVSSVLDAVKPLEA